MQMNSSQKSINFVNQSNYVTAILDPKPLEYILKNLLDSAIKYSPNKTVLDLILSDENQPVIFQTKDQGLEMSVTEKKQIFESLDRGTNINSILGTKLGLSIVKSLVELNEDKITIKSESEVSTKFTLRLSSIIKKVSSEL